MSCPYNDGLNCDECESCATCGWNPEIDKLRREKDKVSDKPLFPWLVRDAKIKELYDQGYNDAEICRMLHYGSGAAKEWREKRNLPPNSRIDWGKAMELVKSGYTDKAIAYELGTDSVEIAKWRSKNNIPCNKAYGNNE